MIDPQAVQRAYDILNQYNQLRQQVDPVHGHQNGGVWREMGYANKAACNLAIREACGQVASDLILKIIGGQIAEKKLAHTCKRAGQFITLAYGEDAARKAETKIAEKMTPPRPNHVKDYVSDGEWKAYMNIARQFISVPKP
ncbi:MAG TPA: hypothetical protein PKW15_03680 [Alphaproteobacteria bacterium]|nr:hypothetical protein [Rhodospirillaceae bacterium]HRJ12327.1 hypothetical protein [Alphaproteobacteria bacterium]